MEYLVSDSFMDESFSLAKIPANTFEVKDLTGKGDYFAWVPNFDTPNLVCDHISFEMRKQGGEFHKFTIPLFGTVEELADRLKAAAESIK